MYSTEIFSNTATIRDVNATKIDSFFTQNCTERDTQEFMLHHSAELQTAKQTLTTSTDSIEVTYSDFPCHLELNRDKRALINRRWKCKKGERLTITANSFTTIDQHYGFRPLWRSG